MTLVHTSFYKITSIFFLISIASHIFVASFYLLQKKNADHCLLASSLPFHSLLANFFATVFCALPPAAFLDCRQGSEELQGVFPPYQGPSKNCFIQPRACKAPAGRLFQIQRLAASLLVVLCFSCSAERPGSVQSPDHATQGALCTEKEMVK